MNAAFMLSECARPLCDSFWCNQISSAVSWIDSALQV